MRDHPDFVPELDFVIELDGQVVGNIMYTRARLVDEAGGEKEILTFGPVCIAPEHQRKGYGKMLMEHSFEEARRLGYDTIVIFGSRRIMLAVASRAAKNIMFPWRGANIRLP